MPWIGPDYQNGGFDGLRVLVLGESHYSWDLEPDEVRYANGTYALSTAVLNARSGSRNTSSLKRLEMLAQMVSLEELRSNVDGAMRPSAAT
jgi:hypothetical protein